MELASVGTLDEAIKVRMFDLKDANQRKMRQIFRAVLRTMRDVAQVRRGEQGDHVRDHLPTMGA